LKEPELHVQDNKPVEFLYPNYDNELERIMNLIALKGAGLTMPQIDEKEVKVKF
jgi:hypothetical protein